MQGMYVAFRVNSLSTKGLWPSLIKLLEACLSLRLGKVLGRLYATKVCRLSVL